MKKFSYFKKFGALILLSIVLIVCSGGGGGGGNDGTIYFSMPNMYLNMIDKLDTTFPAEKR